MGIEQDRDEQNDPTDIAINEQQGPVDPAFIDAIRARTVVEDGSQPTTHPLRRGRIRAGSEIAKIVDPAGQPEQ